MKDRGIRSGMSSLKLFYKKTNFTDDKLVLLTKLGVLINILEKDVI